MKTMILLFGAIFGLSVTLSSCSKLLEPRNLENVKPWLFAHSISENWKKQLAGRYIENEVKKGIDITIINDLDESNDSQIAEYDFNTYLAEWTIAEYLEEIVETDSPLERLNFVKKKVFTDKIWSGRWHIPGALRNRLIEKMRWHPDYVSYLEELVHENLDVFVSNADACLLSLKSELMKEAKPILTVVDWGIVEDTTSDTYTGYYVIYQFRKGVYLLVDLVEYDNEERYEVRLVAKEDSLSEINEHFERL